eukprot:380214-Amphidinium_carterae.1
MKVCQPSTKLISTPFEPVRSNNPEQFLIRRTVQNCTYSVGSQARLPLPMTSVHPEAQACGVIVESVPTQRVGCDALAAILCDQGHLTIAALLYEAVPMIDGGATFTINFATNIGASCRACNLNARRGCI